MRRNFGQHITLDQIIESAIVEIARHPLVDNPPGILYGDGLPAKIVKFRNFSGVEVKEKGLTLSVFPYHYEGESRPTPESKNASVVYKPYSHAGGSAPAIDIATANIKVKLDLLGYTLRTLPKTQTVEGGQRGLFGTSLGVKTFETNDGERVLRQWGEYLRLILTADLMRLGGSVQSSFVTWLNFPTTRWDDKGNAILHSAELMWQVQYNALREWRPEHIVRGKHPMLGSMQVDGAPIFWRPEHDLLVTGFGSVVLTTPSGVPITWDPKASKLIHAKTREPLSTEALRDKGSNEPFIRLDLLPVGVLTKGDVPVYFNKTNNQLVRYDGSQLTQIPGPAARTTEIGELDETDKSAWLDVAWDPAVGRLVYGSTAGERAGRPVEVSDLIDPTTKELYLITGQVFGLNFEIRPAFREFLVFDASA